MNYYVVKITKEETQKTQVIYRYDDYRQAQIAYHNEFAGAIAYDTVLFASACIMDEYLNILEQTKYEKHVPEPVEA